MRLLGGDSDSDSSVSPATPESSLQAALHQSVFLSAMSAQPGRDLSLCWEQHRKLLPGVAGLHAETVQHWSVQQVRERKVLQSYAAAVSLSVSLL